MKIDKPSALSRLRWLTGALRGEDGDADASDLHSGHTRLGWLIIGLFFGVLGVWAAVTSMDSAVLAPGVIVVDSHRKTIQHQEGGTVRELLAKEGDRVTAGQVIVRLDEVRPLAAYESAMYELASLRAQEARLLAERDTASSVKFSEDFLRFVDNPRIAELAASQDELFRAKKNEIKGKIEILKSKNEQLRRIISGLEAQLDGLERQLQLISDEEKAVQELYDKGFERLPRLRALQRAAADLSSQRGRYNEEIGRNRVAISEGLLQIQDLQASQRSEAAKSLEAVQAKILEVGERFRAAKHVVEHLDIRAPAEGVIVNMRVHSEGAVLMPGAPVADLVPLNDLLVVDAQLQPQDINDVHPGMRADVSLTAFHQRTTPKVSGSVVRVSADRLVDERTGAPYYLARIEIPRAEVDALGPGHDLYPGMPADVAVPTGARTVLQYLVQPLTQHFDKALREQ